MVVWSSTFVAATAMAVGQTVFALIPPALEDRQADPCAAIAGQTYVIPSKVLACLNSFSFNTTLRDNIVDVVSKTLNFHTSTNYQIQAPDPYTDIHVDLQAELARIKKSTYDNDFSLHKDVSTQVKRLIDGHCVYINYCYDSLYVTYLPFPLVLLNDVNALDVQNIFIAPEAYEVASKEFAPFIADWEKLAGYSFAKYSGAKVVEIDGKNPWDSVAASAAVVGGYQARSTRESSFFASYQRAATEWSYRMGDFAAKSLPPTSDTVTLKVIPAGSTNPETITVPYISRFGSASTAFTDGPSLWAGNCLAKSDTNGVDYFASSSPQSDFRVSDAEDSAPITLVDPTPRFAPSIPPEDRKHPIASFIDVTAVQDITLPPRLQPPAPVNGAGTARFYLDGKVGILSLGSFSTGASFTQWFQILKDGIVSLKAQGATHLIVDVTNNGGGYICVAHWLHRLLAGPSSATEPQAGFDTKARYSPLASKIVQWIADGNAPERDYLLYDPVSWKFANSTVRFPPDYNWLEPPVKEFINGHDDAFSQRLGEECHPYPMEPLAEAPFPIENIGIINNGRCASSCSIFTINMVQKHATKIAVLGGRQGYTQFYAGIVGGQSTSFAVIDSEVKSTHYKDDAAAPPDFITDSYQGLTWRLAFGIYDPRPAEWAAHPAQFSFPLTVNTANQPLAIWRDVAKRFWPNL